MSQVSIKELQLTGLKNKNKNLENMALQREQEIKTWESKCQELENTNDKLIKQVIVQLHIHGGKHFIWDSIIEEASKFRTYLDYVLDKEVVI